MATLRAIQACVARLNLHVRGNRSDDDVVALTTEWKRMLDAFPDDVISRATDSFILASDWWPSTSEFVAEVQNEARITAREREEARMLPSGADPSRDVLGNAHVEATAIREALALHLVPDDDAPTLYNWSRCSGCDGSHYVLLDARKNIVRPCEVCNPEVHALWRGGHLEPDHYCEVCRPSRRRRSVDAN